MLGLWFACRQHGGVGAVGSEDDGWWAWPFARTRGRPSCALDHSTRSVGACQSATSNALIKVQRFSGTQPPIDPHAPFWHLETSFRPRLAHCLARGSREVAAHVLVHAGDRRQRFRCGSVRIGGSGRGAAHAAPQRVERARSAATRAARPHDRGDPRPSSRRQKTSGSAATRPHVNRWSP